MRVLTYFYVPLYLTAICLMLVCLRCTGTPFFRESTSGYAVFIASWFDSGYMRQPTWLVFLVIFLRCPQAPDA